jgi:hypothetical protein
MKALTWKNWLILAEDEQNKTKWRVRYHQNPQNEGVSKPFEGVAKGLNGSNKGFEGVEGVFSKLSL